MQHQHQKPLDIILCLPCRVPLGLKRPFSGLEVELGALARVARTDYEQLAASLAPATQAALQQVATTDIHK